MWDLVKRHTDPNRPTKTRSGQLARQQDIPNGKDNINKEFDTQDPGEANSGNAKEDKKPTDRKAHV